MAKYRKKPVVIEATQWFVMGDHPEDGDVVARYLGNEEDDTVAIGGGTRHGIFTPNDAEKPKVMEGNVVRYYRTPSEDGSRECERCSKIMHMHGWMDTLEGGHIVCPGDWIITGVAGERYPCKPDIFDATYDPVNDGEC